MDNSNDTSQKIQEPAVVEVAGKITIVAILVLFVVALVFILYRHRVGQDGTTTRRRGQMDFTAGAHGLDPAYLESLPKVLFSPHDFKDGFKCTVCLSRVSEGENIRLLPKCNHGFHVKCIDMWFSSHSTCPICRNPVLYPNPSIPESEYSSFTVGISTEGSSFPTNV